MAVKKTSEEKIIKVRDYYSKNKESIQAKRKETRNTTLRGRCSALKANAASRSKTKGWPFDLTIDFLVDLWNEQEGYCALTGRELLIGSTNRRWSEDLVSIDRIDNNKGYTKDNVWLVAQPVNYAKGVQTLEEFVRMCRQVIEVHGDLDDGS